MRQTESQAEQARIQKKISDCIASEIDPILSAHMGGAVLTAFADGIAYIKFTGSCNGCYAAEDTLENTVRPLLLSRVPELQDVVLDDTVSEELLDFARSLLRHDGTPGKGGPSCT